MPNKLRQSEVPSNALTCHSDLVLLNEGPYEPHDEVDVPLEDIVTP